ncbi:hypothetical protein Dimus_014193 [Dionaea muscipula]
MSSNVNMEEIKRGYKRSAMTDIEMQMLQDPESADSEMESADIEMGPGPSRGRDVIRSPEKGVDGGAEVMMISFGLQKSILEGDVRGYLEATRDFGLMKFQGPGGDTVLHIAARAGRSELITSILREHKDLIRTKNWRGELPLHVAARAGELDSVKCLVDWILQEYYQEEQGNMVAKVNRDGDTALHIALENHNEELAAYLVDKYPSASYYVNHLQVSPLYLAIKAGYWQLVQSMLARKPIGDEDVKNRLLQGKSVVHAVIMVRNPDLLATMLNSQSVLMDTRDEEGRTPLACAAFIGCLDAVSYFLDKFPDYVYKVDEDGSFPIHKAAQGGRVIVMKKFLSRFPNMKNLLNQHGESILHMASRRGKADMVSYLLKMNGINRLINLRDGDGNTPLHLAVKGGYAKVVSIFTWDERVDLSLLDKLGMTALDAIEYYGGNLPRYEQRLAWIALRHANAPRRRHRRPKSNPNPPNSDNYKDRVNTLLLVSTLVATVTFAAGFTVPGGYSSSGIAIFADKPTFKIFVITNTIALYSSILAVIALIYAQLGDLRLILISLKFAVPFLGISLTMMSTTFMVGIYLLVNHIRWLSIVILVMGSIFLASVFMFFIPLYSPSSIKHRFVRYIFYVPFRIMLLLIHRNDTDKDS